MIYFLFYFCFLGIQMGAECCGIGRLNNDVKLLVSTPIYLAGQTSMLYLGMV